MDGYSIFLKTEAVKQETPSTRLRKLWCPWKNFWMATKILKLSQLFPDDSKACADLR
jgi:hypothetical protein